jgi:hypothetical protein
MDTAARLYNTKDVDMLLAAATIAETAIARKEFLQSKRPSWKDPFFESLRDDINAAINSYLGVDDAAVLRSATQALMAVQKAALEDLAAFKVQLMEDFRNDPARRRELLTLLGFSEYLKPAQRGDQEALIQLLLQFAKQMTPFLRDEIIGKGMAPATITAITAHANEMTAKNIFQEIAKGQRKTQTAKAVAALNDIYARVISVCRIARTFYKDDPAVADAFSFTQPSTKPAPLRGLVGMKHHDLPNLRPAGAWRKRGIGCFQPRPHHNVRPWLFIC